MKFSELKLNSKLAQAIEAKGYSEQSEIQEKAIPLILEGKDLLGQARTGTGKTAAFAIPLIESVDLAGPKPQVLVLVPTRELAVQVEREAKSLAMGQGIYSLSVFGGQSISTQQRMLRKGQHIIVATPGRLMDLMRRGDLSLSGIKAVVLDEADKMFDMGFREDMDFILSKCPRERQTLLFSATMSREIRSLASKHLKQDAVFVNVSEDKLTVEEIDQFYISVDPREKISILVDLIKFKEMTKCMVFCRTRRTVDWLVGKLEKRGIRAKPIHGGMPQRARQHLVDGFTSGRVPVLVTTDLLARGMDISDVSHIINYDFPKEKKTYVHRIGRTARFGKRGEAITFCSNSMEQQDIGEIQAMTNTKIYELVPE